ncbi:DUF3558 family protein [Streptomyces sp. HMX87]|uniref:DUF3558 family protein n=1 Tax=Streptomyces sp. HMX87 TaxID=3390849 RepID=UPI003A838E46
MQRRAQLDQRVQRDPGVSPTPSGQRGRAKRRHRALVCVTAVPAMLVAAGCSSDSGSEGGGDKSAEKSASASASPSPTVRAAVYGQLPAEPCSAVTEKTLGELVPKGAKSGKEGASNDTATRASCSWDSLDNNGVKGSQFRWLNVSMLRFESDVTRGEGDKRAQEYYQKQVEDAQAVEGAKGTKTQPLSGTGDEATAVRYDLKKKEGTFKQQTVVVRTENVVVTVDYNGAGLAGDKTPDADDLMKDARKAAEEAVAAVAAANDEGGASKAPSKDPSKTPSGDASKSSAKGASKSASPSTKS